MPTASPGDTVRVHYTGKLDDGSVFDSSRDREPLEFTLGTGQVIPGFETAVLGLEIGKSRTHRIEAEDAYGPHDEEMLMEVLRSLLPKDMDPKVGDVLLVRDGEGREVQVVVAEAGAETLVFDGNHPLAGKALTFEIELVEIVG